MPTPGTLTRDNIGFSMPADAALYPAPPTTTPPRA